MTDVVCNASVAGGLSALGFAVFVNSVFNTGVQVTTDEIWTSMLNSIIGSYTAANNETLPVHRYATSEALAADYGMWVLIDIPNTVISFIMLDISKNGDFCLFNESLGSTVDALGNTYI